MRARFYQSFHAFTHKNYRIFWFGQLISLIGTWMQSVSQPWLAYSITKSPFLLGVVGALQFTPILIFSLFTGAYVDRLNKRYLIIGAQLILAILAVFYSLLVFSGHIQFWHILVLASLQGIVSAVEMPARQSFIVELVGKDDLMNAIALNSTIFNAARIIGPAIAGIVMAKIGIAYCFLFNALSFIPVITGLFFIKPLLIPKNETRKKILLEIADGFRYIVRDKNLLQTMLMVSIVSTFIMNFNVLIPLFAKTVLKTNETGFGYLMSCMGMGSFLGALSIASKSKSGPQERILVGAAIAVSLIFILVGFNTFYFLSFLLIGLAGFLAVSFLTTANSIVQLKSNDDFRSRVISIYFFVNAGSIPFGNLFVGALCDHFGVKRSFIFIGLLVLILVLTLLWITRKQMSNELAAPDLLNLELGKEG